MKDEYPYSTITINGKEVELANILSGKVDAQSDFEHETFLFLQEWLSGKNSFILHTSGSTGEPKPITISKTQMQASAHLSIQAFDLKQNDLAFVCIHTKYIGGKMMLVRALEAGLKIIAKEPAANPLQGIKIHPDFIALVPLQLQAILESQNQDWEFLNLAKAIIIGGATVSNTLKHSLQKIAAPVYSTYGMTETVSHIALQKLNGDDQDPYFHTLPGITIEKDNRDCLVIQSPFLSQKIITNDVVEIANENKFLWLGRWDNVINTGGIKVITEKIEVEVDKILKSLNINQKFFISGLPDERFGQRIVLVLEGKLPKQKDRILSMLSQRLNKYEIPKEIISIPNFKYTLSGKIDRKMMYK